jgi:hypothetical protein
MSDYTKSTDFASKDSLPSGDAAKIVKGTEIDTEFNNIAVAIGTKADLASPGFSGSPTAPTQSSGDSSTKLATTGFVQAAITTGIAGAYPVGSIYVNAAVSTNPSTLLGFGTWVAFGAGRVMVGFDAGNPLFDTAQETGGSADAIVVSHSHSASSSVSDPGHDHQVRESTFLANSGNGFATGTQQQNRFVTSESNTTGISVSTSINSTGSSGTNANYQPYITVYMWRRTA